MDNRDFQHYYVSAYIKQIHMYANVYPLEIDSAHNCELEQQGWTDAINFLCHACHEHAQNCPILLLFSCT